MGAKWTDAERVIVAEIWKMPVRVEDLLHRVPGRTRDAVYREAEKLKLGPKAIAPRDPAVQLEATKVTLRTVLKADKGMSMDEIYAESRHGKHRLRAAIEEMLAAKEAHISEYVGSYRVAHYKLGKGVNAVRPAGLTREERRARFDAKRAAAAPKETDEQKAARLDVKYRARDCSWWPAADVTVGTAMRAMVEAGRQSA